MQSEDQKKKLLLVGATAGSVHVKNYYYLIRDYFSEVLIVGNSAVDYCQHEVIDFSIRNPLNALRNIRKLKSIIKKFNPDIIHVHQANSCAYITSKANTVNKPLVLTTWGSDVLLMPQKGFLHRRIVKYVLENADVITADANFMAKSISDLGIHKKVVIANFGIDYNEIDIPEKKKIIYSNRLHVPLYRIDLIIKAFADFEKEYPGWKLVLGARGDQTQELKELAAVKLKDGSYEFIGFVDQEENKRQYLQALIWVSVPESDGTSISLLEAMGYGCIPVVSDLPANEEWITNGENGIVVKGDSLTTALTAAVNMNLDIAQKRNIDLVLNKATKEVNRKLFTTIYDNILKN